MPPAIKPTTSVTAAAQSVLDAGRLVERFLTDRESLPFAIKQLEAAAEKHETGVDGVVSLGFAELDRPEPASQGAAHDVLVTVLADFDVASVLVAAGQASGDGVAPPGDPALLDQALGRLAQTTRSMSAEAAVPLRFGFGEPDPPQPEPASPTPEAAAQRLRERTGEALTTLYKQTGSVAGKIATALKDMAPEAVTEAMQKLGEAVPAVPKVGRLLGRGLRVLRRALETLGRLLRLDVAGKVRGWVGELWERAKAGTLLDPLLRQMFGHDETTALVDDVLSRTPGTADLDTASTELTALTRGFTAVAETLHQQITRLTAVTGVAVVAAHFLPPLLPWIAPTAALGYLLVLAVAIVVAMDYADSGLDRGHIVGVRGVLQGIGQ